MYGRSAAAERTLCEKTLICCFVLGAEVQAKLCDRLLLGQTGLWQFSGMAAGSAYWSDRFQYFRIVIFDILPSATTVS